MLVILRTQSRLQNKSHLIFKSLKPNLKNKINIIQLFKQN